MPFVVFVGVGWPSRGLASQARPLELLVIFRVMCAAAATGTGAVCAVLVYIMDGANRAPPRVALSGGGEHRFTLCSHRLPITKPDEALVTVERWFDWDGMPRN